MGYCPVCNRDHDTSSCPDCGTPTESRPRDYGRSVGQLIGKLQEQAILTFLEDTGIEFKHSVQMNTPISVDDTRLTQESDVLISVDGTPTISIESKYLRSKKHAREKVYQMVCMSQMLTSAYPNLKTYAILTGNFTDSALAIADWGLDEVYHIPFETLEPRLRNLGVHIDWGADKHTDALLESTWERCHTLMAAADSRLIDAFFDGEALTTNLLEDVNTHLEHEF